MLSNIISVNLPKMKTILLVCSILFVNEVLTSSSRIERTNHLFKRTTPPVTKSMPKSDEYFIQKLDHFNSRTWNEETWKQKYFVNTENFNSEAKNVAFIMLGGEDEAHEFWMTYGNWAAAASKYGAIMFQLEHRFYGESQPLPDLSLENLQYLSSEQALADAADFIEAMNEKYSLSSDVKWIAFGGSYAGSLSAWLRLKYPNLVHGAVASSAPLLSKVDFFEYFQVVIDDLNDRNKECVNSLKSAMQQIDYLLNKSMPGLNVTDIFNLCEPIEDRTGYDVEIFYNLISTIFGKTAQYSKQGGTSLDGLCNRLVNSEEDEEYIFRLSSIVKEEYGDECLNYNYEEDVAYLSNITIRNELGRQWYYQTCTEFGLYTSTNREDGIFGQGSSVSVYTSLCNDVFGFDEAYITEKIDQTNANYGGTNINATNVVYVHGSLDPLHAVGLLEAINPESPVIYIEGTSHCADMATIKEDDLPQLTAAKEEIQRLIGVWLGMN